VSRRRDDEFTQYVAARLGSLRRTAFLLCQDWQLADDLVQTTITRLYVHWARASTLEHTDVYVRTILVRAFLAERRSGWVRRVSLDAVLPDTPWPDPDLAAALDVRAALASLPPRQRATVILRFYCDMNVDQAAQVLGLLRTIDETDKHEQTLCAADVHGLSIVIDLDVSIPGTNDTPLPGSDGFGSALAVFGHLRLFGSDPARWSTSPLTRARSA